MTKVTLDEAARSFEEVVAKVRNSHEAVVVEDASGDLVRVVPIPIPVGEWKGRPVYHVQDLQYLDAPWFFE